MIFIMFMCIYPMESHALARLQSEIKGQDGWSYWKIESKKVVNSTYYGSYRTVGSATVRKKDAPQTITASGSSTFGHQISGSVKVTYGVLESTVGFERSFSQKESISITKRNAKAGTYLLQIRGVYRRYKVKQQKYFHIDGHNIKMGKPVYCYVNVYRYKDYRLRKK